MVNQAKIDESNISLINSDLALSVRKAAASNEDQYSDAGKHAGVEIWRVENFGIQRWPKEQYGKFYSGDSYIVLNSYPKPNSDKLLYNVHFWLGESTTQDEAGVAAWKTVELDDLLGQLPVQFREVQGFESQEFVDLFKHPGIMILDGGVDSAFNVVKPTEYKPRLLHVKGKRNFVRVKQVPLSRDSLNEGDVFVLDNGLQLFQWNGTSAGVFEKRKGNETATLIREDRQGRPSFRVLDGNEACDEFWGPLGGLGQIKSASDGGEDEAVASGIKRLIRLSDDSGTLQLSEVSSGKISKSDLDPDDVFLVDDNGTSLFVWVGSGASPDERAKCFQYANQYIGDNNLPFTIPVSRVTEGNTSVAFEKAFD